MSGRLRCGIRIIKNGQVRINGRYYRPDDSYRGELDGQRWYFMTYPNLPSLLAMWGDEKRHNANNAGIKAYNKDCKRHEANMDPKDGTIRWYFWHEVNMQ
jgi:hypothetical protein